MVIKAAVGILAMTLMAACQLPGSEPSCSNVQIDWVNFIQIGSTQYVAGPTQSPAVLQETDLGPVYAHVKFKVNGKLPSKQLAARFNGQIVAYTVMAPSL